MFLCLQWIVWQQKFDQVMLRTKKQEVSTACLLNTVLLILGKELCKEIVNNGHSDNTNRLQYLMHYIYNVLRVLLLIMWRKTCFSTDGFSVKFFTSSSERFLLNPQWVQWRTVYGTCIHGHPSCTSIKCCVFLFKCLMSFSVTYLFIMQWQLELI